MSEPYRERAVPGAESIMLNPRCFLAVSIGIGGGGCDGALRDLWGGGASTFGGRVVMVAGLSLTFLSSSDLEMIGLTSSVIFCLKERLLDDLEELLCPSLEDLDFDLDRRRDGGWAGMRGDGVNLSLVAV